MACVTFQQDALSSYLPLISKLQPLTIPDPYFGALQDPADPCAQGADLEGICDLPAQHTGHQVRRALDAHLDALLAVHSQVGGGGQVSEIRP